MVYIIYALVLQGYHWSGSCQYIFGYSQETREALGPRDVCLVGLAPPVKFWDFNYN